MADWKVAILTGVYVLAVGITHLRPYRLVTTTHKRVGGYVCLWGHAFYFPRKPGGHNNLISTVKKNN